MRLTTWLALSPLAVVTLVTLVVVVTVVTLLDVVTVDPRVPGVVDAVPETTSAVGGGPATVDWTVALQAVWP